MNKITFEERIHDFIKLGNLLSNLELRTNMAQLAFQKNPWFTIDNCLLAFEGLSKWLNPENLYSWSKSYHFEFGKVKNIGVVMAGNIPMVGFHDFLCVLISGNRLSAKLSTQDDFLIPEIASKLIEINSEWRHYLSFEERLNNVDAVITTGSNNTARYFEYYFRNIPRILRMNRTSLAILDGNENEEDFSGLGKDIFSYFGLGCRNIAKVFLPTGYDPYKLVLALQSFNDLVNHHKYGNNYMYQKALLLLDQKAFIDGQFFLLLESEHLASPIAIINYEYYESPKNIQEKLVHYQDKLQCFVSRCGQFEGSVPMGKAQFPELWDYSDNIDTLRFLQSLN